MAKLYPVPFCRMAAFLCARNIPAITGMSDGDEKICYMQSTIRREQKMCRGVSVYDRTDAEPPVDLAIHGGSGFCELLFIDIGPGEEDRIDGYAAFPMPEEVSGFLTELASERHYIPMSHGVIHNGLTHVTEGPLTGHEYRIIRIDRHKRIAWLKLSQKEKLNLDRDSTDVIVVGLEITEKNEACI
ncbi:MAG: hypothetical protein LUC50_05675 [Ruminococcus sp.]|nr:hypothetical protein [Ruminococcus sp.]